MITIKEVHVLYQEISNRNSWKYNPETCKNWEEYPQAARKGLGLMIELLVLHFEHLGIALVCGIYPDTTCIIYCI